MKAWRREILIWHPDKTTNEADKKFYTKKFREITEAKNKLLNLSENIKESTPNMNSFKPTDPWPTEEQFKKADSQIPTEDQFRSYFKNDNFFEDLNAKFEEALKKKQVRLERKKEAENNDKKLLHIWLKDKLVNPKTGRKITEKGPVYKYWEKLSTSI